MPSWIFFSGLTAIDWIAGEVSRTGCFLSLVFGSAFRIHQASFGHDRSESTPGKVRQGAEEGVHTVLYPDSVELPSKRNVITDKLCCFCCQLYMHPTACSLSFDLNGID